MLHLTTLVTSVIIDKPGEEALPNTMTSKELIRKLKKIGWKEEDSTKGKGSHVALVKGDKELIIPFHTNKDLKPGTLHRLLKDAGLK